MSTQAAEQHEKAAEQYGHAARHYKKPPNTIRRAIARKLCIMRIPCMGTMNRPRVMRQKRPNTRRTYEEIGLLG